MSALQGVMGVGAKGAKLVGASLQKQKQQGEKRRSSVDGFSLSGGGGVKCRATNGGPTSSQMLQGMMRKAQPEMISVSHAGQAEGFMVNRAFMDCVARERENHLSQISALVNENSMLKQNMASAAFVPVLVPVPSAAGVAGTTSLGVPMMPMGAVVDSPTTVTTTTTMDGDSVAPMSTDNPREEERKTIPRRRRKLRVQGLERKRTQKS